MQLLIRNAKFSYAYIYQPTKPDKYGKPGQYQVDILWHKSDQNTTNEVNAAITQMYAQAQQDPKFADVIVRGSFKWDIVKDGARQKFGKKDYDLYKDYFYIVAKSREPIQVIDQSGLLLLSDREFFAGCTGNAGVDIKLYSPTKNVPESGYGINAKLLALMKTGGTEADRLAGSVSVEANQFFGVQPQMPGFAPPGAPQQFPNPGGVMGAYPAQPQAPQQYQPAPPQFQPNGYPQQPQAPQAPQFAGQPAAPGFPGQPGAAPAVPQFPGVGPQPGYPGGQVGGVPQGMPQVPAPVAQSYGPPAVGANPFPQVAQPPQQPGWGAPQQFAGPPAQPAPAQHQTTPAWPPAQQQPAAPQGYDPYAQPGTGPGQLPY